MLDGRWRGCWLSKSAELRDNYGIEWEITGVATRRMGWRASDDAIDVANLLPVTTIQPQEHQ